MPTAQHTNRTMTSSSGPTRCRSTKGSWATGRAVTTGLLHATHYLKDNRLLPRGFDKGRRTRHRGSWRGSERPVIHRRRRPRALSASRRHTTSTSSYGISRSRSGGRRTCAPTTRPNPVVSSTTSRPWRVIPQWSLRRPAAASAAPLPPFGDTVLRDKRAALISAWRIPSFSQWHLEI